MFKQKLGILLNFYWPSMAENLARNFAKTGQVLYVIFVISIRL